jgi:hypothetical protein
VISILFEKLQERDGLLTQLEKIEDKAMKSLESIGENETELEIDSNFVKQMNELKNKIGWFVFLIYFDSV